MRITKDDLRESFAMMNGVDKEKVRAELRTLVVSTIDEDAALYPRCDLRNQNESGKKNHKRAGEYQGFFIDSVHYLDKSQMHFYFGFDNYNEDVKEGMFTKSINSYIHVAGVRTRMQVNYYFMWIQW